MNALQVRGAEKSKDCTNIIGLSSGYHDSACAILCNGQLVAAVQEERLSRIKNDKAFPSQSVAYCLEAANITITDIDCIAYYEDPCVKTSRQIWMALFPETPPERRQLILRKISSPRPEQTIRRMLGYEGRIEIVDHHLSHSASSYYFSGFAEAAVMTVDGVGEWATTTYGAGNGRRLERFEQVDFPHSLGLFYSAVTGYLGFEVNEGEYKVMGLAAYGNTKYVDHLRKVIKTSSGGQYFLDMKYFAFLRSDLMYSEALLELLGHPARQPHSEIAQFHMDVARSAQVLLEEIMLEKILFRLSSDRSSSASGGELEIRAVLPGIRGS
jgi:carbamoyltransferase